MMETQFEDAPFNSHSCLHKMKVSKDSKFEIGIYTVMFGFRIRAGLHNKMFVEVDYCGGADPTMINLIYNCMLAIMEERISKGEHPFKGLPIQDVKPMINDPECLVKLLDIVKDCQMQEIISLTSSDLQTFRAKTFEHLV